MADYKYECVNVRVRDGIAWVFMNRPDKRNAMSPQLHYDMDDALARLEVEAANADIAGAQKTPAEFVIMDRHGGRRSILDSATAQNATIREGDVELAAPEPGCEAEREARHARDVLKKRVDIGGCESRRFRHCTVHFIPRPPVKNMDSS